MEGGHLLFFCEPYISLFKPGERGCIEAVVESFLLGTPLTGLVVEMVFLEALVLIAPGFKKVLVDLVYDF